jgi:hypothetical protein
MSIVHPVMDLRKAKNCQETPISAGTGKSNGRKLTSKNNTSLGVVTDIAPHLENRELFTIQRYVAEEITRINTNYDGEDREYLKGMLAYNVGHMVLSIENYKNYSLKTLDKIFEEFGTTFEEVKRAIRRDLHWQEW